MIKRYLGKRNNPWELLVIAALPIISGIIMVLWQGSFPFPAFGGTITRVTLWSQTQLHILGWFGILFGGLLILLYFYTRRIIARDEEAQPPRFLGSRH